MTGLDRKVFTADEIWRSYERQQARNLRIRFIKTGVITPGYAMKPTRLVKVNQEWVIDR